jgi:hypothetical protein
MLVELIRTGDRRTLTNQHRILQAEGMSIQGTPHDSEDFAVAVPRHAFQTFGKMRKTPQRFPLEDTATNHDLKPRTCAARNQNSAATSERLGAKAKVAKFPVLDDFACQRECDLLARDCSSR